MLTICDVQTILAFSAQKRNQGSAKKQACLIAEPLARFAGN